MPEYNSNLRALNDIMADYGLSAGHRFEIDAWNALAVHFGGGGGHQFNIDAMNEIISRIGGFGTFQFEIDAVNEISRVFGGGSDFRFVEDALSEISDLPVFDAGSGPEWLPEGATAYADPVLEHCYADGSERVLSDLFTGVNARDASGILVNGVVDNWPVATALLRSMMPDIGWSALIEFDWPADSGFTPRLLVLYSANEEHGAEVLIKSSDEAMQLSSWLGGYDAQSDTVPFGLNKAGMTFNGSDFTVASLNGATVPVSSPGDDPFTPGHIRFGFNYGGTSPLVGTIKKITIFAPLDQAGLNTRTA